MYLDYFFTLIVSDYAIISKYAKYAKYAIIAIISK